jgi:restriction system protein
MIFLEILLALILAAAFFHFYVTKQRNNYKTALLANHIDTSEEMKRTLAMGLYLRFKKEEPDDLNTGKYSGIYIKQDPLNFESFVADVIKRSRGGKTWVSPTSGDFGVDFEHETVRGKYLGQVKCYKGDLPFDPIALIHSNMVKQDAAGGYVITTGSFTSASKSYAEGLNVELIDGVQLVELWLEGLEKVEDEIKQVLPKYI